METKVQQPESGDAALANDFARIEGSDPGTLAMLPPATEPDNQWQQISRQISNFLEQLPTYLGSFFQEYKLPIISFALLVAGVATLKILLAILDTLNDIPLLSATFELIGMSYAIWFTLRYLLKASTRQELAAELNSIKKQIVGENISELLS